MATREIAVLPVAELIGLELMEEGACVVIVKAPDGKELGFQLTGDQATELSGALLERSRDKMRAAGTAPELPEIDADFHVSNVEELPPEEDLFVFRMASQKGPFLTFRFGARTVRRWRNMLTDHLVRFERRSKN